MRLFIAVPISPEVQANAVQLLDELSQAAQRSQADVKWVRKDQIHFTLKFLGDCFAEQMEGMRQVLRGVAQDVRSFQLTAGPWGQFPSKGSPRVLWLGVQEGQP